MHCYDINVTILVILRCIKTRVCRIVASCVFIMLSSRHHCPFPRHFCRPGRSPVTTGRSLPSPNPSPGDHSCFLSEVKIFLKMLNVINTFIQYVFCLLLFLNFESYLGRFCLSLGTEKNHPFLLALTPCLHLGSTWNLCLCPE